MQATQISLTLTDPKLRVVDLKKYSVRQLDEFIGQLESGMNDIMQTGDQIKVGLLNKLIGSVIDIRNNKKGISF